jgi:hypothetical protein
MSSLKIYQQVYQVGRHAGAKHEILVLDKLLDPKIVRKVEEKNIWEWRAKTDLGCARVFIFGFSKSLNDIPDTWYPVKDADPINTHMTESELREAAIMAVRGECFQQSKFPESVPPLDALILLLRIVKEDPDLIIAPWLDKAIDGDEIYFFLREWEKMYQKNFAPKRLLPNFSL